MKRGAFYFKKPADAFVYEGYSPFKINKALSRVLRRFHKARSFCGEKAVMGIIVRQGKKQESTL